MKVDTALVDPPDTIKLLVSFEPQMQLDILKFYLLNLMTETWRSFTTAQGGTETTHKDVGNLGQIQP